MKGIKSILEQWASVFAGGIAAACCLGVPVVLAALSAAGLGFLIKDTYLFPIFVLLVALSIRVLYRSANKHGRLLPFWVGLAGGVVGTASLWLLVTGIFALSWLIYLSLAVLVIASIWDFINGRYFHCKTDVVCEYPRKKEELGKRIGKGVTIGVAAATAFYTMGKSVEIFSPSSKTDKADIACWGINGCKGTTACSTAFNACTGQNKCKGQGYIYMHEKECAEKGGVPLEKSKANPAKS